MRVLVTGATGFVGAWTALAAQEAGHRVRLLVRNPARLGTSAERIGVRTDDVAVGDMTDAAAVREALTGCDALIHAAAVVDVGRASAGRLERDNMRGVESVVGQAAQLGLQRIVHVSSLAAVHHPGLRVLTADLPVRHGLDPYGNAKAATDQYVRSLRDRGHPITLTYPGGILGPGAGSHFPESVALVTGAAGLRVVPGRRAGSLLIDVRDLAEIHVRALEGDAPLPSVPAGGHRVEAAEIARLLRASGVRVHHLPVPDAALRGAGRVVDALRLPGPMTRSAMNFYTWVPDADNGIAEGLLGRPLRPVAETMADTVTSLRGAGVLR